MGSLPDTCRAGAGRALSGDVRGDACFSSGKARHPAEYSACDASFGYAHDVGRPRCADGSGLSRGGGRLKRRRGEWWICGKHQAFGGVSAILRRLSHRTKSIIEPATKP